MFHSDLYFIAIPNKVALHRYYSTGEGKKLSTGLLSTGSAQL